MVLLKIAFRNIFRSKRRTLLTVLTMFGGFALASISIGWADGAYNHVIDMFTRNRLGHIQIHAGDYLDRPSLYKTIDNYGELGQKLGKVGGIQAWSPRIYTAGLASAGEHTAGVRIVGIDPVREDQATGFHRKIVDGADFSDKPAHEVVIGKGLAVVLKAAVGDDLVIVSQAADGSIANDLYKLVGIAASGDDMSDRTAFYLSLADAQELLVLPDKVHEIAIIAGSLNRVDALTRELKDRLADTGLVVSPWFEVARGFYAAMKADKEGMWIFLLVIILIVAVGVLNTVLMSVLERTREYGLLKAVGTKPGQIVAQVLYEVNIMALFSIVVGAAVGLAVNYLLSRHGISLSEGFTYGGIEFKTMYSEINARSLYLPAITVLLSSTLISIFPALRAARIEPARAMRMR